MARTPKQHRRPWTVQEDRQIKSMAKQQMSWAEIAKALGRTRGAVQQRGIRAGVSLRALRKPARKTFPVGPKATRVAASGKATPIKRQRSRS